MFKDTTKLYVNFLDENKPKSKYKCNNELIRVRDSAAIQKNRSRVLSGVETAGFALIY